MAGHYCSYFWAYV